MKNEIKNEILLRPHHVLCIRFFEGKGYSSDFTKHMAETIERLAEPGRQVRLVDGEDEICRKCPNFGKDGCDQKEKVEGYDRRVIHMTNVSYGENMAFLRLQRLAEREIVEAGRLSEICRDCQWAAICHK